MYPFPNNFTDGKYEDGIRCNVVLCLETSVRNIQMYSIIFHNVFHIYSDLQNLYMYYVILRRLNLLKCLNQVLYYNIFEQENHT